MQQSSKQPQKTQTNPRSIFNSHAIISSNYKHPREEKKKKKKNDRTILRSIGRSSRHVERRRKTGSNEPKSEMGLLLVLGFTRWRVASGSHINQLLDEGWSRSIFKIITQNFWFNTKLYLIIITITIKYQFYPPRLVWVYLWLSIVSENITYKIILKIVKKYL